MAINQALLVSAAVLQEPILDDATGLPLVNGVVTLYQDASRTTFKNWYYLSGAPGNYSYIPLANPLTLNAAGVITDPNGNDTIPYFYPYSEVDNTTPQPYYITVTDSGGHSKITRQNFPFNPANQSVVNTVNATLRNYIINNVFWRNNANGVALNLTNLTSSTLAPSAHQGFINPDITFSKSTTGATDSITFTAFSAGSFLLPIGSNPQNLDVTPEYFMNFTCAAAGAETFKLVQIPLALHLKTLDQVPATFTFWARCNSAASGANVITPQIYQYAGSGAVANSITTKIQAITLPVDSTWHKYTLPFTMPTASGIALGVGGDDAVFLQFAYTFGGSNTFNIDIAKPCFYIGNQSPTNDMQVYDNQEAIFNSPRTGDVRISMNSFSPFGWVPLNNNSIGSSSSGATNRANTDTWPLYNLLWANVNNAFAPVASGRGLSAYADFSGNKAMTLTSALGNVLMGLPALLNVNSYTAGSAPSWNSGTNGYFTAASNATLYPGMPIILTGTSLNAAFTSGNLYYAIPALDGTSTQFQLATSYANAIAGTAIAASGGATGTSIVVTPSLGGAFGQDEHVQLQNELASHNHGTGAGNFALVGGNSSPGANTQSPGAQTINVTTGTGLSYPFNIVQPSLMTNVFIKL